MGILLYMRINYGSFLCFTLSILIDNQAGYGTFVADFHISLGTTPRHCRDLVSD